MCKVDHFIVGTAGGSAIRKHSIWNPSTGEVRAEVALGHTALLDRAVAAAKKVQPEWAVTNPQRRARTMFAFKQLVEANRDELAHFLSSMHGKVIDDAQGDIPRGLEVIEYACSIPQVRKGGYTLGVKDLHLAMDAADDVDAPVPLASRARSLYGTTSARATPRSTSAGSFGR